MAYQLAHHLHACSFGDRVVLLDTLADRYQLLLGHAAAAIAPLARGDAIGSSDIAERLLDRGILIRGGRPRRTPSITPPTCSALEMMDARVRTPTFLAIAHYVLRASLDLRCRGLAPTLKSIDRAASECSRQSLVDTAQAYSRVRRQMPLSWICLRDSIAMHRFLRKSGLAARLVIGVRLDPFAAHCWLQSADMIVNDICDNVAGYSPILVL